MTVTLETLSEVESAMNELQQLEAEIVKESAGANAKIAEVRNELVPTVTPKEEKATRLRNAIQSWAEEHRDDETLFPDGRKTLELRSGSISFRLGAASCTLRKGYTTEDVINELKENGLKAGIKQPDPTLDKNAIKKLYDQGKIDDKTLRQIGLQITQEESVSISLKTVDKYDLATA